MRILFIGGTGEISTACVERSALEGHEVTVFNRGRSSAALPLGVNQIVGDIQDQQAFAALARLNFDVVCQFLAFDNTDIERDLECFSENCGQYIFISTASVYRKPLPVSVIDEYCPIGNPFWEYSRKKQACEETLLVAHAHGRIGATIVRPSHTYRLRLPSIVIAGDHLAWRILKDKPVPVPADGESVWTITHASDFARAFVALFGNPAALGEVFNITDNSGHTWRRLLEAVAETIGRPVTLCPVCTSNLVGYNPSWEGPLKGDKANTLIFDNSKIRKVAKDWTCEVKLQTGLNEAWQATSKRLEADFQPDADTDRLIDQIIREHNK